MNHSAHAFEPEEVMAYLDGELIAERAAAVAAHLDECAECKALAAELRRVSEQMAAWQVQPSPARLAERVLSAAEEPFAKSETTKKLWFKRVERRWPATLRWGVALTGALAVLLVIVAVSVPNLLRSRTATRPAEPTGTLGRLEQEGLPKAPPLLAGPLIVRTASLSLIAQDFDGARAAVERITRQHGGYMAQLSATGHAAAGRILAATLRVPADRLEAALAELRKLGRVEQELQSGEEVTQQYVDLVARLGNAHATEQRLLDVLRQRAGKMADILSVEREIARVREEIERMDAQRKNLEKQVQFATVQVRLNEEYQAQLEVRPPAPAKRLQNAMVEGVRALAETAMDFAVFLLRYGPSLLFWFIVLIWPARFAWRRLRRAVAE